MDAERPERESKNMPAIALHNASLAILEWAGRRPETHYCILCGAPATVLGCFIPDDPECWSVTPLAPGKVRTFWYGLCKTCAVPGVQYRVEERIRLARQVRLN